MGRNNTGNKGRNQEKLATRVTKKLDTREISTLFTNNARKVSKAGYNGCTNTSNKGRSKKNLP